MSKLINAFFPLLINNPSAQKIGDWYDTYDKPICEGFSQNNCNLLKDLNTIAEKLD